MTTFMSVSARESSGVVEVEQRLAVDDADRDRGDRARQRLREPEAVERAVAAMYAPVIDAQRVPPSAWRTSQSSQSVRSPSALKSHTERIARPISRWISIVRPSGRPRVDAAFLPLAGRRRQQRVLGGHPALALAAQPARHALLDRRRAEDDGAALRVEDRAVRLLEEVRLEIEHAELVGARPPVGRVMSQSSGDGLPVT